MTGQLLIDFDKVRARSIQQRGIREQLRQQRVCYEKLTRREAEVFERVVAGKLNKEIADDLGAAERTIKAHRAQVMRKMRVSSVAELVHVAGQLAQNQPAARSSIWTFSRPGAGCI